MIDATLQFLASRLNFYLRMNQPVQEDMAVVSKILENDGKESELSVNKLCLFLVNIENEVNIQKLAKREFDGLREVIPAKQVYLNLYVVLASNFKCMNYVESLGVLSKAITFLQDHSVFDRTNSPDMPIGIEKLLVNMENLGFQDMNSLWGMLGCKYVPSVLYKIRTITLGSGYSYYRPYAISLPNDSVMGVV